MDRPEYTEENPQDQLLLLTQLVFEREDIIKGKIWRC